MNQNDLDLYKKCMELIKLRMASIENILKKQHTTGFIQTDGEFMLLQFRFIFELISISSLCSHRESYEKVKSSFKKEWDINKIIKTVRNINKHFYPFPYYDGEKDENGRIPMIDIKEGYLTEEELIKAYGICGNHLHQYNVYNNYKIIDLELVKTWYKKIMTLLNCHRVHLVNVKEIIAVKMNTLPNGNVTIHSFDLIKKASM